MAFQQVQIAETIRAMKLALKRKADDFDSDTYIHAHTNRGNKLRRGAHAVREGRLDTTAGAAYRKKVSHAGYLRDTISTNPPLYDDDGDLYSPAEDSDAENHDAAPFEDNAFADVRLETLLRPLTSPGALADHPSLSVAYKSKALTDLTRQAEEMVRRERATLWRAKRLLRRFLGDAEWVPCGTFETEGDEALLVGGEEAGSGSVPGSVVDEEVPDVGGDDAGRSSGGGKASGERMEGVETADMAAQAAVEAAEDPTQDGEATEKAATNGDSTMVSGPGGQHTADPGAPLKHPTLKDLTAGSAQPNSEESSTSGRDTNAPSHSMTTRTRARAPLASTSRTPTPNPSDDDDTDSTVPPVHPWYLPPPTLQTASSRNLGLPRREADETRQLLLLYVQRQEHAVRLLTTLYEGLQRAERLRQEVWHAAKAEPHVGEMSDGEDWYDVEDWGLGREELKVGRDGVWGLEKGKDEVEGDAGGGGEEEGRRGGRGRRRAVRI